MLNFWTIFIILGGYAGLSACSSQSGMSTFRANLTQNGDEKGPEDLQATSGAETQDATPSDETISGEDLISEPEMISGAFLSAYIACEWAEAGFRILCRAQKSENDVTKLEFSPDIHWEISGLPEGLTPSDVFEFTQKPTDDPWHLELRIKDSAKFSQDQLVSQGIRIGLTQTGKPDDAEISEKLPGISFDQITIPKERETLTEPVITENLVAEIPETGIKPAEEPASGSETVTECQPAEILIDGVCIKDSGKLVFKSSDTEFSGMTIRNITNPMVDEFQMGKYLIHARPGDTVSLQFNWIVLPRPPDQYCPTCIVLYPYGFIKASPDGGVEKYKTGCVYAGTRSPGTGGTVSNTFTIPDTPDAPGVYYLKKPRTGLVYTCDQTDLIDSPEHLNFDENFAVIIVK